MQKDIRQAGFPDGHPLVLNTSRPVPYGTPKKKLDPNSQSQRDFTPHHVRLISNAHLFYLYFMTILHIPSQGRYTNILVL